ncbi:MAG: heme utilization cystosolic carrier protein HutX [Pseudomonadales bacterium]|nr:heme utilization cystosolic carrier protein HutX [Pseudomonadales bacterium]
MNSNNDNNVIIPGELALDLLEKIPSWGNVTTIIIHAGSVFEFKGPFPTGTNAEGYYNLKGVGESAAAGFEGHLKISGIRDVALQEKQHRGRDSYSFVFTNNKDELVFKIFLGREDDGQVIASQLAAFQQLQTLHK